MTSCEMPSGITTNLRLIPVNYIGVEIVSSEHATIGQCGFNIESVTMPFEQQWVDVSCATGLQLEVHTCMYHKT